LDKQWEVIFDHAAPFLNMKLPNSDEEANGSGKLTDDDANPERNPHVLLEL